VITEEKVRDDLIGVSEDILKDREYIREQLGDVKSLNDYVERKAGRYPDLMAISDPYSNVSLTFAQLLEQMGLFASGLQSLGIQKGDFVALFSESNGRFMPVCHGILRCGAIATLRGSNAPLEELDYVLSHSDAKALVVQNEKTFKNLIPYLGNHNLNFVVIMFKENDYNDLGYPVYSFDEILEKGRNHEFVKPEQELTDPCVMFYTSGTTAMPKGVLITHSNIASQLPAVDLGFMATAGENTLQILPIWHTYEFIAQHLYMMCGCHMHFTNISALKNDLVKYKIDTFMSVPRIWEAMRLGIYQKLKQTSKLGYFIFDFAIRLSIFYKVHKMYSEKRITNKKGRYKWTSSLYHRFMRSFIKPFHVLFSRTIYKKIKDAAGLNFRASISGGGSLSSKDELFYDAIGVNLRIGYGLTETSPVLTLRCVNDKNYLGSAGKPIMGTELKIVDPETFEDLGKFTKGLIFARGPQVMNGYYKNEEATRAVLREDGWFNTGDLGWLTNDNNLVIVGRLKETIVLSSGENVEPVPIEDACLESPYIAQIVLVGQDEQNLGALVVPSEEALEKCGMLARDFNKGKNLAIKNPTLRALIKHEINTYIKNKPNLKAFEKIKQFEVIKDSFRTDNGMLSHTLKMKRNQIFDKYKEIISKMFSEK